eukprot:evm.model.NODE_11739_length_6285_cov_43.343040.3
MSRRQLLTPGSIRTKQLLVEARRWERERRRTRKRHGGGGGGGKGWNEEEDKDEEKDEEEEEEEVESAEMRAAAAEADRMVLSLCLPAHEAMVELWQISMLGKRGREGGWGRATGTIRLLCDPLADGVNPGGASYALRLFVDAH